MCSPASDGVRWRFSNGLYYTQAASSASMLTEVLHIVNPTSLQTFGLTNRDVALQGRKAFAEAGGSMRGSAI